ncbi:MAG: hypothetical protein K8R60_03305 [Burkholderiales bacterium]|nr:hypothetical protein [Burkholderiales bacterium]
MAVAMTVESGLAAHFKQPEGPSVPGVEWLVRIEHEGRIHHARVRALLAADASAATRKDEAYQAQTTMQYLAESIEQGWNPAEEGEHVIHIGNPHGQPAEAARPAQSARPWWRFW